MENSRSLPLILLLISSLALINALIPFEEWQNHVKREFHKCCEDTYSSPSPADRCVLNAATLGEGDVFHLFYNEFTLKAKSFRSNSMPVIGKIAGAKLTDTWPSIPIADNEKIDAIIFFESNYLLVYNKAHYIYSKTQKHVKTTTDCTFHPILCPNPQKGEVISLATFSTADPMRTWAVIYKAEANSEKYSFNALRSKGPTAKKVSVADISGSPSAIAVYRKDLTKNVEIVVEFTTSGFACFFERSFSQETFSFSRPPPTGAGQVMPECWQSSMFLGCPQSFCFSNDVDDVFYKNAMGTSKSSIVVMRGSYGWELLLPIAEFLQLPISPRPHRSNAHVLGSTYVFQELPKHVDAAEMILDDAGDQEVIVFKDTTVHIFHQIFKLTKVFRELGAEFSDFVDASWFNSVTKELFIFKGINFWVFNVTASRAARSLSATLVGEKRFIGKNLKGLPADIDGAVAINGRVYFFKQQWFYEGYEVGWDTERSLKVYAPQLMFGDKTKKIGFFDSIADCFGTEWAKAESRLNKHIPRPAPDPEATLPPTEPNRTTNLTDASTKSSERPGSDTTQKDSGGSFVWWVVGLLLLGVLLVVAAIAFYCIYTGKKTKEPPKAEVETNKSAEPVGGPLSASSPRVPQKGSQTSLGKEAVPATSRSDQQSVGSMRVTSIPSLKGTETQQQLAV